MPAIRWRQAKAYDAAGADELCFPRHHRLVRQPRTIFDVVARTAEHCFMPLTVGGGVRAVEDIRKLAAGRRRQGLDQHRRGQRTRISCAEAADKFGNQCIVVAIDAKKSVGPGEARWEIFTHGGREPTGIDAVAFAEKVTELGAGEILLTSMDRDGTKAGYDIPLTRAIADAVPCR
jgi:cyclase